MEKSMLDIISAAISRMEEIGSLERGSGYMPNEDGC